MTTELRPQNRPPISQGKHAPDLLQPLLDLLQLPSQTTLRGLVTYDELAPPTGCAVVGETKKVEGRHLLACLSRLIPGSPPEGYSPCLLLRKAEAKS